MDVHVGDQILVGGHRTVHRRCEVLAVLEPDGGAPYLVRWTDDALQVVFVPGPDATVVHGDGADVPAS